MTIDAVYICLIFLKLLLHDLIQLGFITFKPRLAFQIVGS